MNTTDEKDTTTGPAPDAPVEETPAVPAETPAETGDATAADSTVPANTDGE